MRNIGQSLRNSHEKSWHFESTGTVVWDSDNNEMNSDGSDSNSEACMKQVTVTTVVYFINFSCYYSFISHI
jgi:hypothetical protein